MPYATEIPVLPVAGKLCVSVQDWTVSLELITHEEIPHLDSLTALDGKRVIILVSSEECNTAALPVENLQRLECPMGASVRVPTELLGNAENLAESRTRLENTLAIDEALYGPEAPAVAANVRNLGAVLHTLGDLAGAHALFERALAIDEALYGPEASAVAADLGNLGGVLQNLRDLAGARALFERALAIDEALYGSEALAVTLDFNNLGNICHALGNVAEVQAALERAVGILRICLGETNLLTLAAQSNLAALTANRRCL